MELNFRKWLEYSGPVTTTFSNQLNDKFKRVPSRYVAGKPSKEDLEDDISKQDFDKKFLGRRAPRLKYIPPQKYMKKDK